MMFFNIKSCVRDREENKIEEAKKQAIEECIKTVKIGQVWGEIPTKSDGDPFDKINLVNFKIDDIRSGWIKSGRYLTLTLERLCKAYQMLENENGRIVLKEENK